MLANYRNILVVLFILAQCGLASVHKIYHNVATIVSLQDGDEIVLDSMPLSWGVSRVVLGVNSVPALQLSGYLTINGCKYYLDNSYKQIDFAYNSVISVKYYGSAQKLPIQWWVDSAPIQSKCDDGFESARKDSIRSILQHFVDSVHAFRIKDYVDLGEINSVTNFEGSSEMFKITKLPDWFYNQINVMIEATDGRELRGYVYVGGKRVKVEGWSSRFTLYQKTSLVPFFEIAFPEYRKVRVRWWVESKSVSKTEVKAKENIFSEDSIKVDYLFGQTPYTKEVVSLVFDKNSFRDKKIPSVERLSFDPQGPNRSADLAIRGAIYDVHAVLNSGDSVVFALPLEFVYDVERDSVTIEHFIEEENRWIEESVDSIVENYAYFKVGHFSWLRTLCRTITTGIVHTMFPAVAVCETLSEECKRIVSGAINSVADVEAGAMNGVGWVMTLLENLACDSFGVVKDMIFPPQDSMWSIGQGKLDTAAIRKHGVDVIKELKKLREMPLKMLSKTQCGNGTPLQTCRWETTKDNLDILLADAILAQFPPSDGDSSYGKNKYVFSMDEEKGMLKTIAGDSVKEMKYTDYFMSHSSFVDEAVTSIDGVLQCFNVVNYNGSKIQSYVNFYKSLFSLSGYTETCHDFFDLIVGNDLGYLGSTYDCAVDGISGLSFLVDNFGGYTDILQKISDVMVRVSLLAWLKNGDDFRNFSLLKYKTTYDGIRAWLELVGPFLAENNIVVKTYGSLALYEYIHYGTKENLDMINSGLNRHYGPNGGYSEGMGYSQYIWDDLTYVLAALQDAYKSKNVNFPGINGKFLKSPDYIFEFSRPVRTVVENVYYPLGLIPVEADDGVTYNPDYRVWAKLKNDPKYLAMSEAFPLKAENGKINVLVSFGFPDDSLYKSSRKILPQRDSLWGSFKDGVGLITVVKNRDTVALSMIAEDGELWTRGQAHDQQDNLSITLSSSKSGFLIQDRGYSSFDKRGSSDKFHRYNDHNVLTYEEGQGDNKHIPFSDIWPRAYDILDDYPGFSLDLLIGIFDLCNRVGNKDYNFTVEGGQDASVLERRIEDYENKVVGYTARMTWSHKKDDTYDAVIENNRTILYFGENFWVIDRPNMAGLNWLANSPINSWEKTKLKLYSSAQKDAVDLGAENNQNGFDIVQKVFRADFHFNDRGEVVLTNYPYSLSDENALTYVMTYALGETSLERDELNCKENYQCFMSLNKRLRLVVPPRGEKFKICDVLPFDECSGDVFSNGITMFTNLENDGKWNSSWVLDGRLTCVEKGREEECESVKVSKTNYSFARKDGSVVNGKYSNAYLPAVPILLLR